MINSRPDLRPASIIVLGTTKITKPQQEIFEIFGWGLADLDQQLITGKAKGVAEAVTRGYTAAGRAAQIMDNGTPLAHDNVVIFVDDELRERLTNRMPGWEQRGWIILTADNLTDWAETYLFVLNEMGSTLFPEHGDGGRK